MSRRSPWQSLFIVLAALWIGACSSGNDCVSREAHRKLPTDAPQQPDVTAVAPQFGADSDRDGVPDVFDLAPQDAASALPPLVAETEFNNNIIDANAVGRSAPFLLSGSLANGTSYRVDSDYFSFTATAGARIAVVVFAGTVEKGALVPVSSAIATPRATVLDDTGAPVAGRTISTRSGEGLGLVMPKAGTYYVEISDVRIAEEEYDVPWVALVLPDADLDGLDDTIEAQLGSDPERSDSDGDGLDDSLEIYWYTALGADADAMAPDAVWDPDGDGIAAWLDVDSDGDGIGDEQEGAGDADGDGVPNFLDTDANGDGIGDSRQAGGSYHLPSDQDHDGIPDYLDNDVDGDGLVNAIDRLEKPAGDACNFYVADKPEYAWDDNALVASAVRAVSGTSVLPSALVGGWRFEVAGRNFIDGVQVEVPTLSGSVAVTPIAVYASLLTAIAPDAVSDGEVSILDRGRRSVPLPVVGIGPDDPLLLRVDPSVVEAGDVVTLTGRGLVGYATSIDIEGERQRLRIASSATDAVATASLPATAASGVIRAVADGVVSNGLPLTVVRTVQVSVAALPSAAEPGTGGYVIAGIDDVLEVDRAGDAGALRVDAEADVLTLNGEDKNGPYAIYAALVLPDDTSVDLSAESTAIQAIFVGLGYMASQPVTRWSLIRSEIAATPEVGEFATVLAERLDRNPRAFAAFEDGRLLDAYGAALAAAAERVATTLQSTTGLAPAVPDFKPAQEQEGVRLEPIEPADIDLQNDTKLYMSARVVAADGTEIRPHIRHPWDSNIIGPQGWGLLFIASSTNVPVAGRDSTFEIITAGARGNSADGYVRSYLVGRLVLDGVVLPLFNEFMLKKLLGQKLRSQDAASILIDLIGPDKWNGVIQSIISNPNGMMRTVKKRIFDVIVDQFLASCLQLPPGDACQAFAKVVARGLGWLTPEAVLKKLSAQVAKQIAVYITPYLGQIKAAWEGLGAVNTFGSVVLSATDMLSTSGQINFELDYPLEIQSVQPACLAPDPDGKPVKLYVNGRGFNPVPQGSLFWKKTVKPEVSLGRADGDPVYIRPDGSAMTVEFATGDLSDGEYHLVVRHQNQTVESDAVIQVAADSIQATGLEPAKGAAGTRVRIYGCGFSTRLGDHTVTFAGKDGRVNAPVLAATPAFLVVSVPKEAVSGDVIVTVGDRTSEPLPFEVEEANVTITYGDCGAANDDTFALYVDGAVVSSMPAPSRPFPVAVNVSTGAHTVSLLGITAPDDVGTYCIEFSGNVTVRSGPSLSGDDLTAGVRKTWQIDVGAGTGSAKPGPASIRGQTKPGLDG